MSSRKQLDLPKERAEPKPPKPMTIVLLMWLVIVTILAIGLGMVNIYTVVTQFCNRAEVRRILQDGKDSEHYTYNAGTQEACARVALPTQKDPDNCYASSAEYNQVVLPYTIASLLQLFVLAFGIYGIWTFYQNEKFNLSTLFSFLTIILWGLSSLISAL